MSRRLFGVAAVLLGLASLVLRHQLISDWALPGAEVFLVATSLVQIAGGAALLFPRTNRIGSVVLAAVYVLFAFTYVPEIAAYPRAYFSWGDIFYKLSLVAGALAAYQLSSPKADSPASKALAVLLGLCSASFGIEQVEYLSRTSSLVPAWMPAGQTFWAWATTVAFLLAGIALVSGYASLLAARLLAVMLAIFGVLVWIPILFVDSAKLSNWSEGLETFAIAGAAWVVADSIAMTERRRRR